MRDEETYIGPQSVWSVRARASAASGCKVLAIQDRTPKAAHVSAVFFAIAAAYWKRGAVGWAVIWLVVGMYVASVALYAAAAAAVIARCSRRNRVA